MSARPCTRCACGLEETDLRCPVCGHATPTLDAPPTTVRTQVLKCTACAASIAYDPDVEAPACVYCGSVYELEEHEDPLEQTDAWLPFRVTADEASAALRAWWSTLGWFRPDDLRQASRLEELRPVWWVGWCFNASARVSWAADTNHGARKASWAPHAGQTDLEFDNLVVPATQGLTWKEAVTVAESCDLNTAGDDRDGPTDAVAELFTVRRSSGRQKVMAAIEAESRARVVNNALPGSCHRNLKTTVLLRELRTRRYAFPAWVLAYRYREKLYRAVISGQDARSVQGTAPYSGIKIAIAILGAGALLAGLAALVSLAQGG